MHAYVCVMHMCIGVFTRRKSWRLKRLFVTSPPALLLLQRPLINAPTHTHTHSYAVVHLQAHTSRKFLNCCFSPLCTQHQRSPPAGVAAAVVGVLVVVVVIVVCLPKGGKNCKHSYAMLASTCRVGSGHGHGSSTGACVCVYVSMYRYACNFSSMPVVQVLPSSSTQLSRRQRQHSPPTGRRCQHSAVPM